MKTLYARAKQVIISTWRKHSLWRLSLSIAAMLWLAVAVALFSIYQLSIQPLIKSRQQILLQHAQQLQSASEANKTSTLPQILDDTLYSPQGIITVLRSDSGELHGSLNHFPKTLPHCPTLEPFPVVRDHQGIVLLEGCQFEIRGYSVLVATDSEYLWQVQDNFENAAIIVLICTFFIALIPSWIIRRKMKAQLYGIHSVVSQIEKGRFHSRITTNNSHDEWDNIAHYINAMLDEIESSITQIQSVTDAIAHDLRTPLTRIKNRISTIEHWPEDKPICPDFIAQINDEFDSLLHTFNAMLELSKLESDHDKSHFVSLDFANIITDATDLVEPALEEKQQSLNMQLQSVAFQGEPSLLFRLVYNLLDNAHKYCPENSTISISLTPESLIIQDDGPGVAEQQQQKILQRLYRADKSRNTPGHGLGLTLVAVVAKRHDMGIDIGFSYPEQNKGLKITLQLPHTKA
ncbi:two-component sensor histidine kinase [Vibrio sp. UCD-FRSSP16_10]|uniref:sensor histidine kinase n=1 Tax=unclassified Vibrio TaxID=2614977 RepID=UPI0007FC97E4|nr:MULTISPECIES: HAMP domain-containing sensor histidine kinase [unclassified Vibrio]OBT13988.1 two-component sensor histidine kinase [Vibrio sp. UCD-FRSSP16_30]OBT22869.1 two-component sensor histidine kinase [Vibrio sp. UCD-FRSSP16_10]